MPGPGHVTDKRSFRLYFRGEYGPRELAYPLFGAEPGQTYDRLVLLTEGQRRLAVQCKCRIQQCQGGDAVFVRDQLVRDLHEDDGAGGGTGTLGGVISEWGLLGAV